MPGLNPQDHPICFAEPKRVTIHSGWYEHIPFAMFLVELMKPKIFVELGTQHGDSYCAFCQAVRELKLDTACYAVDTWEGDEHAGFYGPSVLVNLKEHHDALYGSFSRLIKSTFDEALKYFPDSSIDLLHIDGCHTYEAVKHDFESWLSKMSSRGVILLHDTNMREREFGVWKLWEEVKSQYPHFEFLNGCGLGTLAVGESVGADTLNGLFSLSPDEIAEVRAFFFQRGFLVSLQTQNMIMSKKLEEDRKNLKNKEREISNLWNMVHTRDSIIKQKDIAIRQLEQSVPMRLAYRCVGIGKRLMPGYYYSAVVNRIRSLVK